MLAPARAPVIRIMALQTEIPGAGLAQGLTLMRIGIIKRGNLNREDYFILSDFKSEKWYRHVILLIYTCRYLQSTPSTVLFDINVLKLYTTLRM